MRNPGRRRLDLFLEFGLIQFLALTVFGQIEQRRGITIESPFGQMVQPGRAYPSALIVGDENLVLAADPDSGSR